MISCSALFQISLSVLVFGIKVRYEFDEFG